MNVNEFNKTAKTYIDTLPSLSRSAETKSKYQYVLANFGLYLAKNCEENETINALTVVNWRESLAASGVKQNTIRDYMTDLQAFFSWCISLHVGGIDENPITAEQKPPKEEITYTILSENDIDDVIEKLPKRMHIKNACRNRAIVILLLQSGLRADELLSLTPSDLDFGVGTVYVRHGKGNKKRFAPFPSEARKAVKDYLESGERPTELNENDFLFGTSAGKDGHKAEGNAWHKMTAENLNKIVKKYVHGITGKEIHTHLCRHAAASVWDDKGVPLRMISGALGHSSTAITETVYIQTLNHERAATTINEIYG